MERKFREFSKFRESEKLLKRKLGQFKDLVCYPCLADSVVKYWFLTQEVADLNNPFNYEYFSN